MLHKIFAATTSFGGRIGDNCDGLGPFCTAMDHVQSLQAITRVVSSIVGVITAVAGIWFFLNFIVAGIQWIGAGGDKHTLEEAQKRITNAFIGLIIVVAGWSILALAGKFLGFDILISKPADLIQQLFPGNPVPLPSN
jgi:hypothetical protein